MQEEPIEAQAPDGGRETAVAAPPPAAPEPAPPPADAWPEASVGRLMQPPIGVFGPERTVGAVVEELRDLVRRAFVTYVFVTGPDGRLVGVVAMRELLLSSREQPLHEVMIRDPFSLRADTPLIDAMRSVLGRHFPVYPVCDADGRLVGLVRGQEMFEAQAFELSAQAGSMVGVEKAERVGTRLLTSWRFRHPWLQLNLLTGFLAAGVVGAFQSTINEVVLLAVFLPVIAGQTGNTGAQALAVAIRGLTLGDLRPGTESRLVVKETLLGLLNGALVGVTAGVAMYLYAVGQGHPDALLLSLVVLLALAGSCAVGGIVGALVPLLLDRWGADPATASSIVLTTATDVVSLGFFLMLASWLVV